jgi:hypothetical protein
MESRSTAGDYLDRGIQEVNTIGGPAITRADFIPPPTMRQRCKTRLKAVHRNTTYQLVRNTAGVCVLLGAVLGGGTRLLDYADNKALAEQAAELAAQTKAENEHKTELVKQADKEWALFKEDHRVWGAQRERDVQVIRDFEHNVEAPAVQQMMTEIWKAEGKYNAIGNEDAFIVRLPKESPALYNIITDKRITEAQYVELSSCCSPRGYGFKTVYKLPAFPGGIKAEIVECLIHGHRGMKQADDCFREVEEKKDD